MPGLTRRESMAVSLAAMIGAPWRPEAAAAAEDLVRYGNEQEYAITHSAVVETNDVALRSLEIWVPVPTDQPEQLIRGLKIEPRAPIVRDVGGQAAVAKLYLNRGLPGPKESLQLQVSYRITCRPPTLVEEEVRKHRFGPYRKDRWYRHFTRPEKKIETTLPAIVEQAKKLGDAARDPLEIARAAYDWVLDRTEYKLIEGFGGAAYCLDRGHGECGDYSALFVALCRAAGIPARPAVGFWADAVDGWHCWAEFMLPSGHWIPVDPSIGDQSAQKRRRYFGGSDNRRVAVCKTCDVSLLGPAVGHREVEYLQVGAWWWHATKSAGGNPHPTARFSVTGRRVKA